MGSLHFPHGSPANGVCLGFFFKYFAAGREEACRVPPNLCWGPRFTRQGALHFHMGPLALACVWVYVLQVFGC
jgi:hypothetical protein